MTKGQISWKLRRNSRCVDFECNLNFRIWPLSVIFHAISICSLNRRNSSRNTPRRWAFCGPLLRRAEMRAPPKVASSAYRTNRNASPLKRGRGGERKECPRVCEARSQGPSHEMLRNGKIASYRGFGLGASSQSKTARRLTRDSSQTEAPLPATRGLGIKQQTGEETNTETNRWALGLSACGPAVCSGLEGPGAGLLGVRAPQNEKRHLN